MEAARAIEPEAHDRLDDRAQTLAAVTLLVDRIEPARGLALGRIARQPDDGKRRRVVTLAQAAGEISCASTRNPRGRNDAIEGNSRRIVDGKQIQRLGDGTYPANAYISGNRGEDVTEKPGICRAVLDMEEHGIGNDMQHETEGPSGSRDNSRPPGYQGSVEELFTKGRGVPGKSPSSADRPRSDHMSR